MDRHKTAEALSHERDIGEEKRIVHDNKHQQHLMEKNPYLRFGLGINGYFLLLESLIKTFMVISVLAVFQITIFAANNAHVK